MNGTIRSSDISSIMYGQKSPAVLQFLQNNYNTYMNTVSSMGNPVASQMMQRVASIWEETNSLNAIRRAESIASRSVGVVNQIFIHTCETLHDLQTAGPVMQRYLMANPVVREAYIRQEIDGYSSSYVDLEPEAIGKDHTDYRTIMNGMVVAVPATKDEPETWKYSIYFDEAIEGDIPLRFDQRCDFRDAWELQNYYLEHTDEDSTSKFGDKR